MFITDAQVHIWTADTADRPWVPGRHAHRDVPFGAEDLIAELDGAGVDRCVLVPPSWQGARNDLALQAAADCPGRLGVMGLVDVRKPDSVDLSSWLEEPNMLGIRLIFTRPGSEEFGAEQFLHDGTAEWLFSAAERWNIPLMIWCPRQNAALGEVARRHPSLRIILDHLNVPLEVRDDAIGPQLAEVLPIAAHPNVAVKISGLPMLVHEPYPFPHLHPHIRAVIETFGIERCMWGSDLTRLPCPYVDWVRAITDGIDFLSEQEKALFMSGTLERWLNWPKAD